MTLVVSGTSQIEFRDRSNLSLFAGGLYPNITSKNKHFAIALV